MKDSKAGTKSVSKGESHRIYWQQWPSSVNHNKRKPTVSSRRDLITSSAAIRISPDGARAKDVTELLCETLNLKSTTTDSDSRPSSPRQESWDRVQDAWERDSLVLVGTLYSLPWQYVRFEHERMDPNSSASADGSKSFMSRNDPPFHVIKTLRGTDNPIQVRNEMIKHLEAILRQSAASSPTTTGRKSSVSPKLQWYFVPGVNHPSSPIPSYIDLEGYSTAMEDDDDDDEECLQPSDPNIEERESENDLEDDDLLHHLSVSLQEKNKLTEEATTALVENTTQKCSSEKERIFKKERQLFFELSMCQSSIQQDCISGYLSKQSMADPHVWKRMHCVLTDDHLWYMSRIYTRLDDDQEKEQQEPENKQQQFYSFAKHRRMGLTRALLLQPSVEKPKTPLFRTPFAFEVIDSNGCAHRFRASNPENYKKWVGALQSRIVQSYENSLLEHAELIVRDETEARNKRFQSIAVEPLWDNQQANGGESAIVQSGIYDEIRYSRIEDPTIQMLRFGIEVTQYREHCRHIEAILPAKYPVLAMTDSTPELRLNGSQNGNSDSGSVKSSASSGAFRLDIKTQALIKSAWDEAVRLGSRATRLAVGLQSMGEKPSAAKMPRSLETICQHLEYVITGNLRTSNGKSSPQNCARPDSTRQYPPPIDLFDQLLVELQCAASAVSKKARESAERHVAKQPSSTRRRVMQGDASTKAT